MCVCALCARAYVRACVHYFTSEPGRRVTNGRGQGARHSDVGRRGSLPDTQLPVLAIKTARVRKAQTRWLAGRRLFGIYMNETLSQSHPRRTHVLNQRSLDTARHKEPGPGQDKATLKLPPSRIFLYLAFTCRSERQSRECCREGGGKGGRSC